MEFGKRNLLDELNQEEKQDMNLFLADLKYVLKTEISKSTDVLEKLKSSKAKTLDSLNPDILDVSKLYTISQIERLAVKYRLRFLPSKMYKGEYPAEVLQKLVNHEAAHNLEVENLVILAPRKRFELTDCDSDPLLFSKVGENQYYLIAQWGNDVSILRKLALWPMRNAKTAVATIILSALFLAFLVPSSILSSDRETLVWPLRALFFIQLLFIISSIGTLVTFMLGRNFSENEWNSKHFN